MALGDDLIALAKTYYASEVKHVIDGTNAASAAADPALPREARVGYLDEAIGEMALAVSDAKRILQLTGIGNGAGDQAAVDALQGTRKEFTPFDCLRRMGVYDAQAKTWRNRRLSILMGPIQPRPSPPDLGGAGDPVAPPPDGATQLGLVAAAGLILYAAYELLRRAAKGRRTT